MTDVRKQRVEDAVNFALTETRRAAINDCANVILEQWKQCERLLDSKESRAIFNNAYGEKFQALYDKRRNLRSKQEMLMNIVGKLYDVKWDKQKK